jgi:long-chain acyl-CoA synthetase
VKKKPASVGRAIPGVKIKIVDGDGCECRAGETGEIIAKGDNIMIGYWRNRRETAKVLRNGWLRTGDMAFKDEDGDIFITGRKKGIVKLGGYRINPSELECLASEYSGVDCAAAIAKADKTLGRRICLFVSPRPGAKIDAVSLKGHCAARLPVYGRSIDVRVLRSIPKTNYGKIDRKSLEELL